MATTVQVSREGRLFAAKVARSIAEIQESVNNMADVVVFLEVLGYNDTAVQKHGFSSMIELATYVYEFIDAFEPSERSPSRYEVKIPSKVRRLSESLSMIFPWIGSLVLLFTTGASLWMAWGLPAAVTTVFLAGVFLGLAFSEGLVQTMNRLFSFYNAQTNVGEVRRSVARHYALGAVVSSGVVVAIFGVSLAMHIPFGLAVIAALSFTTIVFHRLSFVVLYALRKRWQIIAAYSCAFAALLSVTILLSHSLPDPTIRYFAGLGAAFGILSAFAIYYHYRVMTNSSGIIHRNAPHFFIPLSVNDNTIKSKFSVQLWECLPFAVYGTAFFALLFTDRVISWIFNPVHAVASNGTVLPLAFNSAYHAGADLALFVLVPTAILQYVLAEPIYLLANNKAIVQKVRQRLQMDLFLRYSYRRLVIWTIIAAGVSALVLNLIGPELMTRVGGTDVSLRILRIASVGAVLLSIYTANSIFLILLGRVSTLAKTSVASAGITATVGVIMAIYLGWSGAIFGFIAGTAFAGISSSIIAMDSLKNGTARLFARFI